MKGNAILINPRDNVAVAVEDIGAGEAVRLGDGRELAAVQPIPRGHKVAVEEIPEGRRITKYGETIGAAAKAIRPGEHVHVHNLKPAEG